MLACACLSFAPTGARSEIEVYRHTDGDGVVRYTIQRVPESEAQSSPPDASSPQTADQPGESAPAPDADEAQDTDAEQATSSSVPGSPEDIQRQIERDREVLRDIVSREGGTPLDDRDAPQLREIAERLPRLQSELDALQSEPSP